VYPGMFEFWGKVKMAKTQTLSLTREEIKKKKNLMAKMKFGFTGIIGASFFNYFIWPAYFGR